MEEVRQKFILQEKDNRTILKIIILNQTLILILNLPVIDTDSDFTDELSKENNFIKIKGTFVKKHSYIKQNNSTHKESSSIDNLIK